jgi:predicted dehydrogenase
MYVPKLKLEEPLKTVCRSFLTAIETGEQPVTDGRMGLEVVRILEAAQESLDAGGKRVRP